MNVDLRSTDSLEQAAATRQPVRPTTRLVPPPTGGES